jgi:hypothetical protein
MDYDGWGGKREEKRENQKLENNFHVFGDAISVSNSDLLQMDLKKCRFCWTCMFLETEWLTLFQITHVKRCASYLLNHTKHVGFAQIHLCL